MATGFSPEAQVIEGARLQALGVGGSGDGMGSSSRPPTGCGTR
jgi:hypothetical protein